MMVSLRGVVCEALRAVSQGTAHHLEQGAVQGVLSPGVAGCMARPAAGRSGRG